MNRIEQELRAVQRRVFPGGRAQFVEPEIRPETQAPIQAPPSTTAVSNLTTRVDALETQLRALTGQIEEQDYRTRQLEQQINSLRTDLQARLDRLEPRPEPATSPDASPSDSSAESEGEPTATQSEPSSAADNTPAQSAEEAYNEGFRLWNARRYGEAQQALETAATRHPNSRWTSWMRNLQGRAYLDDGKPATAARIFLANYQDNPTGERAADSLFFLGQALNRLNRRSEACRVYGELEEVYPSMREFIRERLPQARTDARCGEAAARR